MQTRQRIHAFGNGCSTLSLGVFPRGHEVWKDSALGGWSLDLNAVELNLLPNSTKESQCHCSSVDLSVSKGCHTLSPFWWSWCSRCLSSAASENSFTSLQKLVCVLIVWCNYAIWCCVRRSFESFQWSFCRRWFFRSCTSSHRGPRLEAGACDQTCRTLTPHFLILV